MELAKGAYVYHIFSREFKPKFFFNDHHDINKVETVNTYITPCRIGLNKIFFYFEFLNKKTVDYIINFILNTTN